MAPVWTAPSSLAGTGATAANYGRGEHETTGVSVQIPVLPGEGWCGPPALIRAPCTT